MKLPSRSTSTICKEQYVFEASAIAVAVYPMASACNLMCNWQFLNLSDVVLTNIDHTAPAIIRFPLDVERHANGEWVMEILVVGKTGNKEIMKLQYAAKPKDNDKYYE